MQHALPGRRVRLAPVNPCNARPRLLSQALDLGQLHPTEKVSQHFIFVTVAGSEHSDSTP